MAATRWKWLPLGQRPEQSLFSNPETNERGGRLPGGKTLQHQQVCNMDIPLIFPQRCQFQHIDMGGGEGEQILEGFWMHQSQMPWLFIFVSQITQHFVA